jgi:hypothetical protein
MSNRNSSRLQSGFENKSLRIGVNVEEIYAFWRTDQVPFLKWSKVKAILDDGLVEPESCPGARICPVILLPPRPAEKMVAQIQAMEGAYAAEKVALDTKYRALIKQVAPLIA